MSSTQRRDQFLLAFLCALADEETGHPLSIEGFAVAIRAVEQRISPMAKRYSSLNGNLRTDDIANDLAKLREYAFIEIRDGEIFLTEAGVSAGSAFDLPQAWEDLLDIAHSSLQRKTDIA